MREVDIRIKPQKITYKVFKHFLQDFKVTYVLIRTSRYIRALLKLILLILLSNRQKVYPIAVMLTPPTRN